jgi:hypothetical protein
MPVIVQEWPLQVRVKDCILKAPTTPKAHQTFEKLSVLTARSPHLRQTTCIFTLAPKEAESHANPQTLDNPLPHSEPKRPNLTRNSEQFRAIPSNSEKFRAIPSNAEHSEHSEQFRAIPSKVEFSPPKTPKEQN